MKHYIRTARDEFPKKVPIAGILTVMSSLLSGAAFAQDATAPLVKASGEIVGISEVVVTARRRQEYLQRTPVSESVISAKDVAQLNLRNFEDLRGVVSDLEVVPLNNGGTSFTIRGVGQTSAQANVDAKVGFYVNDMYVARQEGNSLYFYDMDTLQVLKGPQGTLFGKNTTGGALLLTTTLPGANDDGYLKLRTGSYSRVDTEGAINLPISDTVLTRLSFRTDYTDGYIKHVLDDGTSDNINDQSVRYQVRLLPVQHLTIDMLAEYNRSSTDGSTDIVTGCGPTDYLIGNYNSVHSVPYCTSYPVLNKPYLVYGGSTLSVPTSTLITDEAVGGDANNANVARDGHPGPFALTTVQTFNGRVSYAFSDTLTLRSITAYRDSNAQSYDPKDNVPNELYAEIDKTGTQQFSEELNLNFRSRNDKLNITSGFFYSSQKTRVVQDTGPDYFDPVSYLYNASNIYRSYAIYAQGSYKLTPKLELTVGGRYTYDEKSAQSSVFTQTNFNSPCDTFIGAFEAGQAKCAGSYLGANAASWRNFDPRVQLSYLINPGVFTYASVTRGYNAGGFNQQLGESLGGTLISYDPEELTSYEMGVKSNWFERKLRVNLAGYFQKYDDIQTTVDVTFNGVITRQVQTGASAHEDGVEAEIVAQPIPPLTLQAEGGYLNQKYDSVRPGADFTVNTPIGSAPNRTYSLVGDYVLHPAGDSVMDLNLNWRWVGAKAECSPAGSCYTPPYGLLGTRIDFQLSPTSLWKLSVWGTNLLDQIYMVNRTYFSLQAYTPGRPREAGLEVVRKF